MKWQKMYFSEYPPMPQIKEWHSSNLNWQSETTMLIQSQWGGGKELLPGMIN